MTPSPSDPIVVQPSVSRRRRLCSSSIRERRDLSVAAVDLFATALLLLDSTEAWSQLYPKYRNREIILVQA